jgi:hypothetical protein
MIITQSLSMSNPASGGQEDPLMTREEHQTSQE